MATVKGTAKTDKFTVNASNVIVVTGKKTSTNKISKNGKNKIYGAAAKDTFTVKGGKLNYIYGDAGNDIITVTGKIGTGNRIYGDDAKNKVSGNDTFHIKGGNKNYFYGGKGNDTFNITGGSGNTLYGEAGADVFKFGSKNWKVTIGEINAEDTLDFSNYKGDYGATMSQAGKNLSISFNRYVGDTQTKIGVINLKNYFAKQGNRFKCVRYNPETNKKQKVTVIAGGNNTRNVSGTSGSDWIITGNGDKKTNAGKGNDMIQVGWGDAGSNGTQIINAGIGDDEIYADGGKNTLNGEDGNDIIFVENTNNNILNGGNGDDILEVYGNGHTLNGGAGNDILIVNSGNNTVLNGGAGADTIRIKSGSGFEINSGSGSDKVYVDGGSAKHIVNSGGTDYIEIGKSAGNGVKVESLGGGSVGYKLVAKETVKVLGGNNHDIRLYGGDDKVIVAGGSGHVIYTDGPTGSGDAGGNDIIVIQDGGKAKKIVAGNGNDVIAVANGAGNGSTIYTGLEDPNRKNSGTGTNTLNLLGGSSHNVYLGGSKNNILVEAQNVTLNKYAGTADDITVRWSEEGTGTLRINCPSTGSSVKSTLRLEGVNSWDFSFSYENVDIKNANGVVSETQKALIMTFDGNYTRKVSNVTRGYQSDDAGYTCLPVYVNTNGSVQYNWCAGNQAASSYTARTVAYSDMPAARIEITHWDSLHLFDGITFDDRSWSFSDICSAATRYNHKIGMG